MIKERFREILEFTKSESPYRKANKGWINKDIFLEFGKSVNKLNEKSELAKVTLIWTPLQRLISNIFLIIILSSIVVFTSIKFAEGKFKIDLFNISVNDKLVDSNTKDISLFKEKKDPSHGKLESKLIQDLDIEGINLSKELIEEENFIKDKQNLIEERNLEDLDKKKDIKILKTQKSKSNFF